MAGGLRYETGREMPPGMQELYGVKLAGEMRIATPAPPARNDNEGGADMPDEELLKELQERAMGLSFDTRYLINELVKRYRIRCFEVVELGRRIAPGAQSATKCSWGATATAEPRNDR